MSLYTNNVEAVCGENLTVSAPISPAETVPIRRLSTAPAVAHASKSSSSARCRPSPLQRLVECRLDRRPARRRVDPNPDRFLVRASHNRLNSTSEMLHPGPPQPEGEMLINWGDVYGASTREVGSQLINS
jgi:hypothetical protein